ncbi:MAG: class I SAM-dependent methyltransferase [Candidatus Levybacteria bacterium]|nr:class I SAM-dependent methyltransferase [Candidatus Levybacteria bacterium]
MNKAFDDNGKCISGICAQYAQGRSTIKILDVGCGDGTLTKVFLYGIPRSCNIQLHGIDRERKCENKDIIYKKVNLESEKFPYPESFFDLVISNQVIEHLLNKDLFISECYRVLQKEGLVVLSTENIASLDNILSILLGNDPLSQHTGSKFNIGSFLSPHFMETMGEGGNKYSHKNVCSYHSFVRLMKLNGFENVKMNSFGYFGTILKFLLPTHGRLITACSRK